MTQIALSFVLLVGAGMLLSALVALQTAHTGYNLRQVLAIDVPLSLETPGATAIDFVQQATRRVAALPGVEHVSVGNFVPWRDATRCCPRSRSTRTATCPRRARSHPRARLRNRRPGFFATLGVTRIAGRDFTDDDTRGRELVVIVSQSVAQRLFAGRRRDRTAWSGGPIPSLARPRRGASSASSPTWTTSASCRGRRRPCITRSGRCRMADACSCARQAIRTRWCRR